MKTSRFLAVAALTLLAGSSIAGVSQRETYYESETDGSGRASSHFRNAGTPGAYYRSNVMRNAVIFRNDSPDFVTFFVYFADNAGPNNVNAMIRNDAFVYEQVVAPYETTFIDQRSRYYWVGSRSGKWTVGSHGILPQAY